MDINVSGVWTGEMKGTNVGGMTLELEHSGNRIYGQGKFHEPTLGTYAYDVQGAAKENQMVFFLSPRPNQGLLLGNIQATCDTIKKDLMTGKWTSSIGTSGVFEIRKYDPATEVSENPTPQSVFLIHGHDEGTKEKVARFLEKLGLSVVILHEQINKGMTIIEKFESYAANAGFAVALFTPDDIGYPMASIENKQPRARQNVVLEMGYFVGKLGRSRVCLLHKGSVELPSDILGVVYAPIDDNNGWQLTLARELRGAGYDVDLNKIVI